LFNIVLISPDIPWNTGAIGRLAVNTSSKLHLIQPLGFQIDDKSIKRAGLDYWNKLNPAVWKSFDTFLEANINFQNRMFFATTKSTQPYFDTDFQEGDFLLFGSEGRGVDIEILNRFKSQNITIPMAKDGRSLNLAMSVSIILYGAIEKNFSKFQKLM
jgi:tRNA (cytidine/uridine-2'-O-)-methyltransferase